jgi:AbrB family looped-hinge helix DNA binding protein
MPTAYDDGAIDGGPMPTVTVSPKFQVVIPQEVREAMDLQPGEKLQVFQFENRIELIPVRTAKEMRGFLRGIDTTVDRDPDRV